MTNVSVREAVLDEMLESADVAWDNLDDFSSYLCGMIRGVSIAQGRHFTEVLESFLTHARRNMCYQHTVRTLETIYDSL